MLLDCSATN